MGTPVLSRAGADRRGAQSLAETRGRRSAEKKRTPFSGDKFSAVREVAETEAGFSFREVQRRLRESKLK
jgi:hypothetical protein